MNADVEPPINQGRILTLSQYEIPSPPPYAPEHRPAFGKRASTLERGLSQSAAFRQTGYPDKAPGAPCRTALTISLVLLLLPVACSKKEPTTASRH